MKEREIKDKNETEAQRGEEIEGNRPRKKEK